MPKGQPKHPRIAAKKRAATLAKNKASAARGMKKTKTPKRTKR